MLCVLNYYNVQHNLKDLFEDYSKGTISLDEALSRIKLLTYRSLGEIAKIDTHRMDRTGIPEAVLAEGKNKDDLVKIVLAHLEETGSVIVTRISEDQLTAFNRINLPDGATSYHNSNARTLVINKAPKISKIGKIGILAAGTADISVAEEAKVVAEEMGCEVISAYDVGVAGIHRLFPNLERMIDVDAIVVAAGREGTLPAIVAGLVDAPVIGLPVSTGYGVGGNGLAALLSMLQSCSVLTVVNIDAGFVAGAYAAKISMMRSSKQKQS